MHKTCHRFTTWLKPPLEFWYWWATILHGEGAVASAIVGPSRREAQKCFEVQNGEKLLNESMINKFAKKKRFDWKWKKIFSFSALRSPTPEPALPTPEPAVSDIPRWKKRMALIEISEIIVYNCNVFVCFRVFAGLVESILRFFTFPQSSTSCGKRFD